MLRGQALTVQSRKYQSLETYFLVSVCPVCCVLSCPRRKLDCEGRLGKFSAKFMEEHFSDVAMLQKRFRARQIASSISEAITEAETELATSDAPTQSNDAPTQSSDAPTQSSATPPSFTVIVGTSAMAEADPHLVERIVEVINGAYFEGNKELLPAGATSYERTSREDVISRLEMGDAGARANRVLHLAFRGTQSIDASAVVGACSSTYQPPWTPEGCGHWGLLSVHPTAMGTGVASALVAAAERRLAGTCERVQIEYEYTVGHAHSQKLMAIYEGKMGFQCPSPKPRGRRTDGNDHLRDAEDSAPETEFRRCQKPLPLRLRLEERPNHLKAIKSDFDAQLAEEAAERQPGGIDRCGETFALGGLKSLSSLNGRHVKVLMFDAEASSYIALVQPHGGQGGDDDEIAGSLLRLDAQYLNDVEDEPDTTENID